MRTLSKLSLLLIAFGVTSVFAQPFTLDKDLTPTNLELMEIEDIEGAKGIFVSHSLPGLSSQYYSINGFIELQVLDVHILSLEDNNQLQVNLVKNNWKHIENTYELQESEDSIINFSFRTHKDFGLKITNSSEEPISYAMAISASPPVESYLKSPFIKATPENSGIPASAANESGNETSNPIKNDDSSGQATPPYLYIVIGILAGIIIMLLFKNKIISNKSGLLIAFISLLCLSSLKAQDRPTDPQIEGLEFLTQKDRRYLEQFVNNRVETLTQSKFNNLIDTYNRLDKVASDIQRKLGQGVATYTVAKKFFDRTETLGNCLSTGTPPGQPRIPSFCVEVDDECATCFRSARDKFNKTRYQFERLQNIYDCYMDYFDAMIAFGDNVSGVHGVAGLAWQTKKIEVLKELKKIDASYDKKRIELLNDLQDSLIELDKCEQQHGLPDWFDRFGSIYLDFMENAYHR